MFTIEDLTKGNCAVTNDGTLQELQQVLKLAFPEDDYCLKGSEKYYSQLLTYQYLWSGSSETKLPTQSVKDFLKQINMEKEIIGYKLIKLEYEKAAIEIAKVNNKNWNGFINGSFVSNDKSVCVDYEKYVDRLKEAGVLDLWFEPTYEEQFKVGDWVTFEIDKCINNFSHCKTKHWSKNLTLPILDISNDQLNFAQEDLNKYADHCYWHSNGSNNKNLFRKATLEEIEKAKETKYIMGSNGDTFELVVRNGKCFHKSDDITNYVKDVQEFAKKLPKKFGNYDFIIDIESIEINKTGCQSCTSLLSQWLKIKL